MEEGGVDVKAVILGATGEWRSFLGVPLQILTYLLLLF
jgi:hypothetical protein